MYTVNGKERQGGIISKMKESSIYEKVESCETCEVNSVQTKEAHKAE